MIRKNKWLKILLYGIITCKKYFEIPFFLNQIIKLNIIQKNASQ